MDDRIGNAEMIRAIKQKKADLEHLFEQASADFCKKLALASKKKKHALLDIASNNSSGLGGLSRYRKLGRHFLLAPIQGKNPVINVGDFTLHSPLPLGPKSGYGPEVSLLQSPMGSIALGLLHNFVSDTFKWCGKNWLLASSGKSYRYYFIIIFFYTNSLSFIFLEYPIYGRGTYSLVCQSSDGSPVPPTGYG